MSQTTRNKHNYYKELKIIHQLPLTKQVILQGFAIIRQNPSRLLYENTCTKAREKRDFQFLRFVTNLYSAFLQESKRTGQIKDVNRKSEKERYLFESDFAESAGEQIIRKEFPSIKYGFDKDFEDYIHSRKKNQRKIYLAIYSRLEIKYPDIETRTQLLKFFRQKSRHFAPLFNHAKRKLAERIVKRVKFRIDSILDHFKEIDYTNALEVLNTISRTLKQLPSNKQKAEIVISRIKDYAFILKYNDTNFGQVSNLIIDYLSDKLFKNENFSSFDPRRISAERERRQKEAKKVKWLKENSYIHNKKKERQIVFDLTKIKFSSKDLNDILIKEGIPTKEGETLAFCHKYWLQINNTNLERKIFLYSKIHKTDHYEIFMRIKNGRRKKKQDNDILFEVHTFLSRNRGYFYSVRTDKQMQKAWRIIKPSEQPALPETTEVTKQQSSVEKQQSSVEKQQSSVEKQQSSVEKQQPPVEKQQPSVEKQQPSVEKQQPSVEKQQPSVEKQQPPAEKQQTLPQKKDNIIQLPNKKRIKHKVAVVAEKREKPVRIKSIFDSIPAEKRKIFKKDFKHKLTKHIKDFLKEFIKEKNIEIPHYKITIVSVNMLHFLEQYMEDPTVDWRFSELRQKVLDVDTIFGTIYDLSPIVNKCFKEVAGDGSK